MAKYHKADSEFSPKPLLVIVSTTSGRHLPGPRAVERALSRQEFAYCLELIEHPNDAAEVIENYTLDDFQAVAVFGGDSTVSCAMKALAGNEIPLIILPGGSTNLIAKEFSVFRSLEANLLAYRKGSYVLRYVPLAEANGTPFIFDLHFGMFTAAVNTASGRLKRFLGHHAYRLRAFRVGLSAPRHRFVLKIDGRLIDQHGYSCFVLAAAGPWLMGTRVGPRPKADRLRVVLIKTKRFYPVFTWALIKYFTGRELPTVTKSWHARQVEIIQAPKKMNFDDQPAVASLPMTIRMGTSTCQVVIPLRSKKSAYGLLQWSKVTYLRFSDRLARMISGIPSERYSRISERFYLGGQYRLRALNRFESRNITGIVNMRSSSKEKLELPPHISILHLSTKDRRAPRLQDLMVGASFISQHIESGGGVYIHCNLGEGRGPTMAAAYLISTGMRPQDAIAHLQQYRPFAKPNKKQRERLEQFAKKIKTA